MFGLFSHVLIENKMISAEHLSLDQLFSHDVSVLFMMSIGFYSCLLLRLAFTLKEIEKLQGKGAPVCA